MVTNQRRRSLPKRNILLVIQQHEALVLPPLINIEVTAIGIVLDQQDHRQRHLLDPKDQTGEIEALEITAASAELEVAHDFQDNHPIQKKMPRMMIWKAKPKQLPLPHRKIRRIPNRRMDTFAR